jgi:secondary thiamine-phosphate synthase enzyme
VPYFLEVQTSGEIDVIDLTPRVNEAIAGRGDGLCVVFMKHTTAALTLASLEEGAAQDLRTVLPLLVPQIDWQHLPPEHNTAHLVSVLLGASVTVPIRNGRLDVGTFQKLVLIDFGPNPQYSTDLQGPTTRIVELHVVASQ